MSLAISSFTGPGGKRGACKATTEKSQGTWEKEPQGQTRGGEEGRAPGRGGRGREGAPDWASGGCCQDGPVQQEVEQGWDGQLLQIKGARCAGF